VSEWVGGWGVMKATVDSGDSGLWPSFQSVYTLGQAGCKSPHVFIIVENVCLFASHDMQTYELHGTD